MLPASSIYALRYAACDANRPDNFLGGDPCEVPKPADHFVSDVGVGRTIIVDGLDRG